METDAITVAYREHYGSIIAALMRDVRDLELAEDLLHEAISIALVKWRDNIPQNPAGWLLTTARRKAIDRLRHEKVTRAKAEEIRVLQIQSGRDPDPDLVGGFQDERLRLIFTCCHPALSIDAQVALTLRTICGLSTPEIAKSFLVPESTLAQRIVRAKKKIKLAGIPYRIPDTDVLPERIDAVLAVLYLVFNEGYHRSHGTDMLSVNLCEEAIRLAEVLETLLDEPELMGLHALMVLHHARRSSRIDDSGDILTLEEQDRTGWDHEKIRWASEHVERALRRGSPGPYQIQAAIAGLHAVASTSEETDWQQISGLYEALLDFNDSPIVRLNRAAAVAMADGPERGLELITAIENEGELEDYALLAAAKADLHRRLDRIDDAIAFYHQAISLTENGAEKRYYQRRIRELGE